MRRVTTLELVLICSIMVLGIALVKEATGATNETEVTGTLYTNDLLLQACDQMMEAMSNQLYYATNGLFTMDDMNMGAGSDVIFMGEDIGGEWLNISPQPTYSNVVFYAENLPSNLTIKVESEGVTNSYIIKGGEIVETPRDVGVTNIGVLYNAK